jgi:UDP-MurNAc hydroxylase
MNVQFLKSATVLIEATGVKILTDPWFVDGEYYGSWAHYPPYEFDAAPFADLDFIYISHIHPDHLSHRTMALLPRHVPVLIHAYATSFLRNSVEALGFRAIELPHNRRTHLKDGVYINILAADNCNPALCGKFFGCAQVERSLGSTQIDSLSVIDDGEHTVVNVNDCFFDLAGESLELVHAQYPDVDLLLTAYSGAGAYPQCFPQLSREEKDRAAAAKKLQFLTQGENFIRAVRPRYYMPFAGTYTLAGRLAALNSHRGVPEVQEACEFYRRSGRIDHERSRCILLASHGQIDLASGEVSSDEEPVDPAAKAQYISEVLSSRQLDYEMSAMPAPDELRRLVPKAYERMERKRREFGFESATVALVSLGDGTAVSVSLKGGGCEYVPEDTANRPAGFVSFRTDPRLLLWLLKGPKHAHWSNAEIGSHIQYVRRPNIYERGLYYVLSSFHV